MKLKILTLTGLLTLCMAAPVEAGVIIDFGVSNDNRTGIIIAPNRHHNWHYAPRIREGLFYRPRYYPHYRLRQFHDSRYQNDRPRLRRKYDQYYYPRRSYIRFGIGF